MSENEKISYDELKEAVEKAVASSIDYDKSKHIPEEIVDTYKELLSVAVIEMLDIIREMYSNERDMQDKIDKFYDVDILKKDAKINTEAFVLLSVPIIFPIEVAAMVENNKEFPTADTLVRMVAQLSGMFLAFCLSTNTSLAANHATSESLEKMSEFFAKRMKEKGFIS